MTRKDYKVIAEALHESYIRKAKFDSIVLQIEKALHSENQKFDFAKFEKVVFGKSMQFTK